MFKRLRVHTGAPRFVGFPQLVESGTEKECNSPIHIAGAVGNENPVNSKYSRP